jgi:hypothetical protein
MSAGERLRVRSRKSIAPLLVSPFIGEIMGQSTENCPYLASSLIKRRKARKQ